MVANPLSTASGVLVRSCDASLGAMFRKVDNYGEILIVWIWFGDGFGMKYICTNTLFWVNNA